MKDLTQEQQKIWDYVNEKFAKVSKIEDMERVLNKPSMKTMWSEADQELIMEYWMLIQYGEPEEEIEIEEEDEADQFGLNYYGDEH